MYTPHYGGSFGQHAWTEIYMGKAGWVPVDSTAHEVDYVDSGHIRLGSKTSFNPEAMEILDYKTASEEKAASPETAIPFENRSWEKGNSWTYEYIYKGSSLGTDTFTVESFTKEGEVYHSSTKLDLKGRTSSGEWKITTQGQPIMYRNQGKAGTVQYSIDCEFHPDKIIVKIVQAGQPLERTIKLHEPVYLLDNNNFSLFVYLLAGLPLAEGKKYSAKAFHPTSLQILPFEIVVKGREKIRIDSKDRDCWICDFDFAGTMLKLWIDSKGSILKESEQNNQLIVNLTKAP
jgi:hypothetical protein